MDRRQTRGSVISQTSFIWETGSRSAGTVWLPQVDADCRRAQQHFAAIATLFCSLFEAQQHKIFERRQNVSVAKFNKQQQQQTAATF